MNDGYFVIRGYNNGKVEITPDEIDGDCVRGMSVYVAKTEQEAVDCLRKKRPGSKYGVTRYGNISRCSNFSIRDASEGGNTGHYLISGITIKDARNKFSTVGKL